MLTETSGVLLLQSCRSRRLSCSGVEGVFHLSWLNMLSAALVTGCLPVLFLGHSSFWTWASSGAVSSLLIPLQDCDGDLYWLIVRYPIHLQWYSVCSRTAKNPFHLFSWGIIGCISLTMVLNFVASTFWGMFSSSTDSEINWEKLSLLSPGMVSQVGSEVNLVKSVLCWRVF